MSDSTAGLSKVPIGSGARGQSLVEFALVVPLLLVLLLVAVDLGRVFFGLVTLTNAARVGANYAALNPRWDADDVTTYGVLVNADAAGRNCELDPPGLPAFTRPDGTATSSPALGDYATVSLTCRFSLLFPFAADILGAGTVSLDADATFPVRSGCASCPPATDAPPPAAPDHCRQVPSFVGMSVAGGRGAWNSAGFSPSEFTPITGRDTETISSFVVTEDDPDAVCPTNWAIFSSGVTIMTATPDPVTVGCATVPNLIGLTVGEARTRWSASFSGDFTPASGEVQRMVTAQATTPSSTAGVSCITTDATVSVSIGNALPAPPPHPCRVPNFTDLRSTQAQPLWEVQGFETQVMLDGPRNDFKIKSQSLVGGDYVSCDSNVTVSNAPR